MKNLKSCLIAVLGLALILVANSCQTTPFTEKTTTVNDEMTTFEGITLNSEVKLENLTKLGVITASRTVNYTLMSNGDYTITMGDYTFTKTALTNTTESIGVRVVGTLKKATTVGGDSLAIPASTGLFGSILGGGAVAIDTAPMDMDAQTVATEAVNFDLMKLCTQKGGAALLMPEYSWEIVTENNGTISNQPLLGPSKTYTDKNITYTVTARATAVSY